MTMTTPEYIENNLSGTFKNGDVVIMVDCTEADVFKKVQWSCETDSFKAKDGSDVVFLKDFSGYFLTKYLLKI